MPPPPFFWCLHKGWPVWLTYARGRGAIKAEGVCWLALPGVQTCSPFEEGTIHARMGGFSVHPLDWS